MSRGLFLVLALQLGAGIGFAEVKDVSDVSKDKGIPASASGKELGVSGQTSNPESNTKVVHSKSKKHAKRKTLSNTASVAPNSPNGINAGAGLIGNGSPADGR